MNNMRLDLLSLSFLLFFGVNLPGQLLIYDQAIYREYFDLVEYDSIELSTDTAGAFNAMASVSQDYFFQNNSKVKGLRLFNQGSLFWESFGDWRGNSCVLKTYELSNQDTIQKEVFYRCIWA